MKKVSGALKNYIVDAILLIALGVVMILWPQSSLKILFTWIGNGFLVMGLIKCVLFFAKKEKKDRRAVDLIVGILQIIVGVLAIVFADFLALHFPVIAAVLLGYGAILMLFRALKLRNGKKGAFTVSLVLGVATLVLAAIVFACSAYFPGLMMQFTGAALIVEGLSLLIVMAQKEG
ncbi:MAG: DUF308 domain-containing protein [Clostridia bacterium]|nr:DUF308 domain-containing protein [Clostridia bacterium]